MFFVASGVHLDLRDLLNDPSALVIKWQAPTFVYKGNLASFYPKFVKHVSLVFHTGASLSDPSGVLGGEGDTSRVLRVLDHDDLDGKADALRGLIAGWITLKG